MKLVLKLMVTLPFYCAGILAAMTDAVFGTRYMAYLDTGLDEY